MPGHGENAPKDHAAQANSADARPGAAPAHADTRPDRLGLDTGRHVGGVQLGSGAPGRSPLPDRGCRFGPGVVRRPVCGRCGARRRGATGAPPPPEAGCLRHASRLGARARRDSSGRGHGHPGPGCGPGRGRAGPRLRRSARGPVLGPVDEGAADGHPVRWLEPRTVAGLARGHRHRCSGHARRGTAGLAAHQATIVNDFKPVADGELSPGDRRPTFTPAQDTLEHRYPEVAAAVNHSAVDMVTIAAQLQSRAGTERGPDDWTESFTFWDVHQRCLEAKARVRLPLLHGEMSRHCDAFGRFAGPRPSRDGLPRRLVVRQPCALRTAGRRFGGRAHLLAPTDASGRLACHGSGSSHRGASREGSDRRDVRCGYQGAGLTRD